MSTQHFLHSRGLNSTLTPNPRHFDAIRMATSAS